MSDHRLERIDFRRPSRFVAVCSCQWRSEPTLNAGLAGALWDRHVDRQPHEEKDRVPIVDVDVTVADAAQELLDTVAPRLKNLVRAGDPLAASDDIERMETLAAVLGDRERRVAGAVRREWTRLIEDPTTRQRATVVVGLVELSERAREHLVRRGSLSRQRP